MLEDLSPPTVALCVAWITSFCATIAACVVVWNEP